MTRARVLICVGFAFVAGCGARSGLAVDAAVEEPAAPPAKVPAAPTCASVAEPEVLAIAVAEGSSCVIWRDHSVWCWGTHESGVLGGLPGDGSRPVVVPALGGARSLACSETGCCVARLDGQVACAGTPRWEWEAEPQGLLPDLAGATLVVAKPSGGCARIDGAGITCFQQRCYDKPKSHCLLETKSLGGSDGARELVATTWFVASDGSARYTPPFDGATTTKVAGLENSLQLAAGLDHACARFPEGRRRCYGHNGYGELGLVPEPITTARADEPVDEPPVEGGAELFLGGYMSCQRTDAGDLLCWGENDVGQLGHDPRRLLDDVREPFPDAIPTKVEGLGCVRSAAVARHHACALTDDGVLCWGRNLDGELGDGTRATRATPAPVVW